VKEVIAQVLFWSCVGCAPLTLVLYGIAFMRIRLRYLFGTILASSVTLCTLLWYFNAAAIGLADKTDKITPRAWITLLPVSVTVSFVIFVIAMIRRWSFK